MSFKFGHVREDSPDVGHSRGVFLLEFDILYAN